MTFRLHNWLAPARPDHPKVVTEPRERRAIVIEVWLVFGTTLGLSGARSLVSLVDSLLRPGPLSKQQVALNAPQATLDLLDLLKQLLSAGQLLGWGALGLYLLWRAGFRLASIGFSRPRWRWLTEGAGLAALIGIPGLALYFVGWRLGLNLAVQPSTVADTWWRPIALIMSAIGNAFAEEVLVIGFLLTRLRQLGRSENTGLLIAAALRGSYHLYQGIGGFIGNLIMGLVFGRVWQRTNRLWPLIIAHSLLDIVAFVGYAALRGKLSWLP